MHKFAFLAILLTVTPLSADKPKPTATAVSYANDAATMAKFTKALGKLAEKEECAYGKALAKKAAENRTTEYATTKPTGKALPAEEVAEKIRASVFIIGSVEGNKADGFEEGRMATAFCIGADGVLMTNYHVFEEINDDEHFGVCSSTGETYALTDILAVNKDADVAVIRIQATGLTPLPLALASPRVGSWVGLLGHPADKYFTYTQGHVSRYHSLPQEDAPATRWMTITAEFAYGSSGSPVVDATGAVVGIAASTENLEYPEAAAPAADNANPALRKKMLRNKPCRRDDPKKDDHVVLVDTGCRLQMVLKYAVPLDELTAILKK